MEGLQRAAQHRSRSTSGWGSQARIRGVQPGQIAVSGEEAAAVGAGAGGFTCAVCYEDCAVEQRAEMPCCGTRQSTVSES